METIQPKTKRKNLARNERLNGDWPVEVYAYDCWIIGNGNKRAPDPLWKAGQYCNQLWNDLTAVFRKAEELDVKRDEPYQSDDGETKTRKVPVLPKEDRAAVWFPLQGRNQKKREGYEAQWARVTDFWGPDVPNLGRIAAKYQGKIPSGVYESVVSRFLTTVGEWRKNPKLKGAPRFKSNFRPESINYLWVYSATRDPKNPERILDTPSGLFHTSTALRARAEYLDRDERRNAPSGAENGHFDVSVDGVTTRIGLHVATHRPVPVGRIKKMALIGNFEPAFNEWRWSLQVSVEHPPCSEPRQMTGRVAGWNSAGWRVIGDRVRIGMLADNAGHFYEVSVPLDRTTASQRRQIAYCQTKGWAYEPPVTFADWLKADADYGKTLQQIKDQLAGDVYNAKGHTWSDEARKCFGGIIKMRDTGLRRLLALVPEGSAAQAVLAEWDQQAQRSARIIRAFEERIDRQKTDAYRKVAAWAAKNFDVIAYDDIKLKELAEDGDRVQEASKYRQYAGQYRFRQFMSEHMARVEGPRPEKRSAKNVSRDCAICGGRADNSRKLLRVCANGHVYDVDKNAATNNLNGLEGLAGIQAEPLDIPAEISRYLRVMPANEIVEGDSAGL